MRDPGILFEDTRGTDRRTGGPFLHDCEAIDPTLCDVIYNALGEIRLTPPQTCAIQKGLLDKKINLLVSSETNSGKTLIGILRIFSAALHSEKKSVYIVPLKAIAEEKLREFTGLVDLLNNATGKNIQITVTTGDYKQTDDFFNSPPPDSGEIIICTPERLEVMLRNPDSHAWAQSIDSFVIDEFHLLGETKRGACLETLLTRIMSLNKDCSIIGLSATIGRIDSIKNWFQINGRELKIIQSNYRFPKLKRRVIAATHKDQWITQQISILAQQPTQRAIIFVSTQARAAKLAQLLENQVGSDVTTFFHAGLSLNEKRNRINAMKSGGIRFTVTTTSLKMGVNFPVTQVIVADCKLHNGNHFRRLTYSDLSQMMGRAGRNEEPGIATLLVDSESDGEHYSNLLSLSKCEEIHPQLVSLRENSYRPEKHKAVDIFNSLVLSELSVLGQGKPDEVLKFVNRTFSASVLSPDLIDIEKSFSILKRMKMIYEKEGSRHLITPTKLGKTVARCGISPESGGIIAGFLRAIITLSEKTDELGKPQNFIHQLTEIDLLFLALACHELRDNWLPKPTKQQLSQTKEFIENLDIHAKPFVNKWRQTEDNKFPTHRLLSTLKIQAEKDRHEQCFYQLLRTATLFYEHSNGQDLTFLAEKYSTTVGKLENQIKPTLTWILSCISQISDPRKAYRLESVKMKSLNLLQNLSIGCELGILLNLGGIGRKTVESLTESGIRTFSDITQEKLHVGGINRTKARKILSYASRRKR